MSPFLHQNSMEMGDGNETGADTVDICKDINDQIVRTKELLEEFKTDSENLQDKLLVQTGQIDSAKLTLALKEKQLREMLDYLEHKKLDIGQVQSQRLHNVDVMTEVFKDTKKFCSKAGQEINQMFDALGFDVDYEQIGGQAAIKIQKDGNWFKLGLTDDLKLMLMDMNPKHERFDDIKTLFDKTRHIAGLFSIYGWSV